MIKILKYGEVPNSEIFARGTAAGFFLFKKVKKSHVSC